MAVQTEVTYLRLWDEPEEHRKALCRAFYDDVYRDAFTNPEHTEDPDTWLSLMSQNRLPGKPRVYIIVACSPYRSASGETVIGGVIFEQYQQSGYWLATYIAVHPKFRGKGVAAELFARMTSVIRELAPSTAWQLLAEAENPLRLQGQERAAAYRRLPILMALGMEVLAIDYVQPALAAEKQPSFDLLMLRWKRPGAPDPTPAGISDFLCEFYAAHDQSRAAGLREMLGQLGKMSKIEPLPLHVPARYDEALGLAEAITLRMTFVSRYLQRAGRDDAGDLQHYGEIPLDRVRPPIQRMPNDRGKAWTLLSDPFSSFYADIVIPFASASSLPIILQCQPFREMSNTERGTCAPLDLRIIFPSVLKIEWEGQTRNVVFSAPDEPQWMVDARLIDSVAIFESGYLSYSVALVFHADGGERPAINAAAILALASIAEPAGRLIGDPVRVDDGVASPKSLHEFLRDRLFGLAAVDRNGTTIFSALASARDPSLGKALGQSLLEMSFSDPTNPQTAVNTKVSLSVEVIGADRHDAVIRAARDATDRRAPVTALTLRLAGLVQNVMDFEEQDESEVHDSLATGRAFGEEITFAHRDLTVRFRRASRAYSEMWTVIGGEPYWFLVEIALSHNARLLADLNEDVRKEQGETGLTGLMMRLVTRPIALLSAQDRATARERLQRAHGRRIRLAHYIPNMFRYPTERSLFDQIVEAKGLVIQQEYFLRLEDTMDKMVREISALETGIAEADDRMAEVEQRASDERRDRLLVAIGVVQATGVFAAFASVFAAIATLSDTNLVSFFTEVAREFDMNILTEPVAKSLPKQTGTISNYAWPLTMALGLMTASFSFIGSVALTYRLRRRVSWSVIVAVATIALVLPAGLTFLVWVLAGALRLPALVVLLLIGLVAGATPGALYLQWSRSSRNAGVHSPIRQTAGPSAR